MALSEPAARQHLHTRSIEARGYVREDGLFDIEADIVDTKTYAFDNEWRGTVDPGEPLHGMRVRVTVTEKLEIIAAEAETSHSPYAICPDAAENFGRLAGLRIRGGWMKEVKARYGREQGCTHILELLNVVGTVAFQTIFPWRERQMREAGADEREIARRGPPIDSCYAFGSTREVVKRFWPDKYTGT